MMKKRTCRSQKRDKKAKKNKLFRLVLVDNKYKINYTYYNNNRTVLIFFYIRTLSVWY